MVEEGCVHSLNGGAESKSSVQNCSAATEVVHMQNLQANSQFSVASMVKNLPDVSSIL